MSSTLLLLAASLVPADPPAVDLWGRWEATFAAPAAASPESELTVLLDSPRGRTHSVSGFWDGGPSWRVRFMPNEVGEWTWRSKSKPIAAGLDGESGTFMVRKPEKPATRFARHGAVRVAASKTHLEHADGTPLFWLGDTVWSGPLRADKKDWETFLDDRVEKHFTAIQFVMAAPWRVDRANAEGKTAYSTDGGKFSIDPEFFRRMDERVAAINAKGLLAVPVLLWSLGDPRWTPGKLPEEQAIRLARYMVARYQGHHVVWILPGDGKYAGEDAERWKRIGRAVFGASPHAPTMLHPGGMHWPYDAFRDEAWLDLLGYQSGHGDDAKTLAWIHSGPPAKAGAEKPTWPILNLEPPYEDHVAYQSKKPHPAYHVRRAAYWSLLTAPPAGLTYGGHGIWSWQTEAGVPADHPNTGVAQPWHKAKDLPGATHMKHLADLFTSLDWWRLRPDQAVVEGQPGGDDPAKFVAAARTESGDLTVVYLPVGGVVKLKANAAGAKAEWFDPRSGTRKEAAASDGVYRAPSEEDWLLIVSRPQP